MQALQRRCGSGVGARPAVGAPRQQLVVRRTSVRRAAIEEKRDTAGSETSSSPADLLNSEEGRRLAELRKQQREAPPSKASGNIIQGALDEAQLISWPKPGKALLDTVLVLGIVSGTGAALFGVNVLLTDAFNWWYSH
ncbi:pre translocase subunit SECE1 [Raphidocelis subcapitata]|uniref:Pre translocase subunit SECE1 n=1 Tax=Raphidocelis subcapitata TaxID=307507 RepID=A0A2V0NS57_9CHLO|nr:pre translocase subunit SECE1 [Raphidocelis subcapitata]|eukprot:GBF89492.1 pre translocase subunit SECE1 [Raphidocelis subcapitata]